MRALRVAAPVILGGVVLSGLIVLASGLWFLRADDLAGADKDWAQPGGAFAMGFFAFMVGAITTAAGAAMVRWFPIGLVGVAAIAIGIGAYVSVVAMDQKPALAPMFIVLHVVFVAAFGLLLPYRLYMTRRAGTSQLARP